MSYLSDDTLTERERCLRIADMSPDEIRLHAGELTAQEMRTVRAVLKYVMSAMRPEPQAPVLPMLHDPKTMTREALEAEVLALRGPVQWVVNSNAELGVCINGRYSFLYEGESLRYQMRKEKPLKVRKVHKREFGEVCRPKFYEVTEEYTEGDGWELLPLEPINYTDDD